MKKKVYSLAIGPLADGKPSSVELVLADSLSQIGDQYRDVEVLSVQVICDNPVIL